MCKCMDKVKQRKASRNKSHPTPALPCFYVQSAGPQTVQGDGFQYNPCAFPHREQSKQAGCCRDALHLNSLTPAQPPQQHHRRLLPKRGRKLPNPPDDAGGSAGAAADGALGGAAGAGAKKLLGAGAGALLPDDPSVGESGGSSELAGCIAAPDGLAHVALTAVPSKKMEEKGAGVYTKRSMPLGTQPINFLLLRTSNRQNSLLPAVAAPQSAGMTPCSRFFARKMLFALGSSLDQRGGIVPVSLLRERSSSSSLSR